MATLTNEHLFLRDAYRCAYCDRHRRELAPRERLTRDYLVPRARGGEDVWLNVVTACSTCNHHKNDRLAREAGLMPRIAPWVPTRSHLMTRRLAAYGTAA